HRDSSRLQEAPGGRPCDARSPLPVGCSPRPVTGQADRGITSRQFSSSASLCRESGLKGALKLARVWSTITTTPAPVP
ncbi:hypothetical protein FKA90_23760, partial [Salmonella enterica subsp. enterica serovar Typhimurium]